MAAKRRRIIIFSIAIALAIIFFMDPVSAVRRMGGAPRSSLDSGKLKEFSIQLTKDAKPALDAAADLVKSRRLTFIGEYGFISDEINFAQSILRRSLELGVTAVGLDMVLQDDQARVDALIAAATFDETEAKTLILRHIPVYGVQEYLEILRTLWETARAASVQGKPFRVFGLSYQQDYSLIANPEDASNPEVLKKILNKGTPDAFMAGVLTEVLAAPDSKVVVFAHRRYGLVKAQEMNYVQGLVSMGFPDARHTGAIVADKTGKAAIGTIFFHAPWNDPESAMDKLCWPFNGWIDQVMKEASPAPGLALPIAIDTGSSAIGASRIEHGDFKSLDSTQPLLSDLCDLYIVLAPIAKLKPAKAIANFVNKDNFAQATEHLPRFVNTTTQSPEGINASIQRNAESLQQELANFQ